MRSQIEPKAIRQAGSRVSEAAQDARVLHAAAVLRRVAQALPGTLSAGAAIGAEDVLRRSVRQLVEQLDRHAHGLGLVAQAWEQLEQRIGAGLSRRSSGEPREDGR